MGDTSIRVSDETRDKLNLHKREGESYDDVIRRLASSDKWAGFGVLSETDQDTRAGMDRMREEMRSGMDSDVRTETE